MKRQFFRKTAAGMLLSAICAICALSAPASHAAPVRPLPAEAGDVRVGIVAFTSPSPYEEIIPQTLAVLGEKLGKSRIVVREYTLADLAEAVQAGSVDVFIASAGFYRSMVPHGANRIATVFSRLHPDPNHAVGSAFIVRADSRAKTLEDTRGLTLGATSPTAFTGYLIGLGEVADRFGDPDKFFGGTKFYGGGAGAEKALDALRKDEVGVISLRNCWLEREVETHPEEKGEFRVLDPRGTDEPCARSTDLYPSWTIGSSPGTAPWISKAVTSAVLAMPETEGGYSWGIATDFRAVDELFRKLRVGHYAYLREWSLTRFLVAWWPALLIALLVVLGSVAHAIRTDRLVKRRTAELRNALRLQQEFEARARRASEKAAFIEKLGIVGELCSVFAHEMRQPLGAITLYAQGMRSLIRRGKASGPQMERALGKLEEQAARASGIVDRVRAYAREKEFVRKRFSLTATVSDALENYEASASVRAKITRHFANDAVLTGDPVEIGLLVHNLVKNAAEAVQGRPDGEVQVTVASSGGTALLSVSDNGPGLSAERLAELESPKASVKSGKHEGLGLGLLIVKAITERAGGRIEFKSDGVKGVAAYVWLPVPAEEEPQEESETPQESIEEKEGKND